MEFYHIVKGVHMLAAYTTAALMLLRLGLDAAGRPGWRATPLRWVPHLNDTVLLAAALGLLALTGWMPFVHHWLTGKVILLVGYILAGKWALDQTRTPGVRGVAALVALGQLVAIFALAILRPL
ncbi:invasion protein [Halovibrio salipaludis]|uniref:Invasion protein n=1 Tax=Halovibrio salipaludis TaxID=2032626 RepID=A0A2A2FBT7_9GAMM|nr:SirB2 family protein [Halovibrio salipaludis]PAU82184.1 invasion protein [Halovibrio salipaludis]